MSTQIYIQPQGSGCQPEYTKIASHSFGFQPSGLPIAGQISAKVSLHTGGTINITVDYDYPTWTADVRNFKMSYAAGNITGLVYSQMSATGIPIPINLVRDDVVTISGNAYLNNLGTYLDFGYDVNLVVGVYYFNCKDVSLELGSAAPVFTFMPVSTIPFTDPKTNEVCFEASVKLGSNFDAHDTRLLVGYNIFATCPDECQPPFIDANISTVSYTLDVQRPCKAVSTSFIIKNCCEGSITELVNIPGLVVGNFHVDNEGNCWEVIDTSTDVTNFTRTFVDNYATCLECQDANPCPLNLTIQSCCVDGIEYVTGSLPGLVVGDTFVDNYGLCWEVTEESGAPISEESITVVSIIEGDCEACTTLNPCPNFYTVESCCAKISGTIAVPDLLSVRDAFVDTNGICWEVILEAPLLPTIYGIVVDTIYPSSEAGSCADCKTANPCPEEYFITIKSCCDNNRVEVAQVPADYMIFNEGTVFSDYWGICWEVLSFNTTGIATFEIWPWNSLPDPNIPSYKECRECLENNGCNGAYNIKDCQTDIVYSNVPLNTDGPPSIGGFYTGGISTPPFEEIYSCFEVLSLGYPTYPGSNKGGLKNGPFATCPECELLLYTTKTLEFSQCCGGPNIIVQYIGLWYTGFGGIAMIPLSEFPEGPYTPTCVTLVGFSTATPTLYNQQDTTINYGSCIDCTNQFPCSEL